VKVSGDSAKVFCGCAEVFSDDGAFLGVLFQKSGRTVCDPHSEQRILTLADDVLTNDSEPTGAAVELTLGLLLPGTENRAISNHVRICING
jgi:hypothetical protein